jgi:hypothetical protein
MTIFKEGLSNKYDCHSECNEEPSPPQPRDTFILPLKDSV